MYPEISQKMTLTSFRISGRWTDAMCIVDRATLGTLTQMCIGCMTKTFSELDARSTIVLTTETFGCFGSRSLSSVLCFRKRGGQQKEICGDTSLSERLSDLSTKDGQLQNWCWNIVCMVQRAFLRLRWLSIAQQSTHAKNVDDGH